MKKTKIMLVVFFLLSGFSALVYEISWTKKLSLVFGNTTFAVSIIVGSYMLGMGIGSYFAGKFVDKRATRALAIYGILEGGIGLYALLFPLILAVIMKIFLLIFPFVGGLAATAHIVRFVLVFVALCVPTFMMGATLPVVLRYYVTSIAKAGENVGFLYGINTLGAVVGTLAGGFFLMEFFGVTGATFFAAGVNLAICVAALAADRFAGAPDAPPAEEKPPVKVANRIEYRAALWGFALAGFLSLAFENLAIRMLAFFFQSHIFAFTSVLAIFLLGLSLGALFAIPLARAKKHLVSILGLQFLICGALSLLCITSYPLGFGSMYDHMVVVAQTFPENTKWGLIGIFLTGSALTLFLPALVMGSIFPVASRLYLSSLKDLGSSIGRLYLANTIGSFAGSLAAGFVLIPLIGMQASLLAVGLTYFACATALFAIDTGFGVRQRWATGATAVVAATVLAIIIIPSLKPFIYHSRVFKREGSSFRYLIDYREDVVFSVSTVGNSNDDSRELFTDEFLATSSTKRMKYMRLMGHLPMLIHPKEGPKKVCVICYGLGNTAGAFAAHDVECLDVVEISSAVFAMSGYPEGENHFADTNHDILKMDFVRPHVNDGRNFLLTAKEKFDVITLDPLLPHSPAAIDLYTADFYALCRDRLADDGLMVQWVPMHSLEIGNYKILLKSFGHVFPHAQVWFFEESSFLIGSKTDFRINLDNLVERFLDDRVQASLREIQHAAGEGASEETKREFVYLLLNSYIAGWEDFEAYVAESKVMTDEHPWVEFYELQPPRLASGGPYLVAIMEDFQKIKKSVFPRLDFGSHDPDNVAAKLDLFARSGDLVFKGRLAERRLDENGDPSPDYESAIAAYGGALELNPNDGNAIFLHNSALFNNSLAESGGLMASLTRADLTREQRSNLASQALSHVDEALKIRPNHHGALLLHGRLEALRGNTAAAERDFLLIIRHSPEFWHAYLELFLLKVDMGETEEAKEIYNKLLDLRPDYADELSARKQDLIKEKVGRLR